MIITNNISIIKINHIAPEKLSPSQKKFNKYIQEVEKLKNNLKEVEAAMPFIEKLYQSQLLPAIENFKAKQIQFVVNLDCIYREQKLTKRVRRSLKGMIAHLSGQVISESSKVNEVVKQIYNTYNNEDYDALKMEEQLAMKDILEELIGEEISNDIDLNDPNMIEALLSDALQKQALLDNERMKLKEERQAKRKKTAKQLEKEANANVNVQNIDACIKDVYRQLIRLLHPDREQDSLERTRKTDVMQKVTVAYKERDLLQLLSLQLEETQTDLALIANLNDEKLDGYNQLLCAQIKNLKSKEQQMKEYLCSRFHLANDFPLKAKRLLSSIKKDIASFNKNLEGLEKNCALMTNPDTLPRWLDINLG